MWLMLPLHFYSVEHQKLQQKFGKKKGELIGKIFGVLSGWGYFIFMTSIWLSPQPRFYFSLMTELFLIIPIIDLKIALFHVIISSPLFFLGAWFGIKGVQETTLEVSESHRTEEIITSGIYSKLRHPQYLGAILSHIAASTLFSALFSMIATTFIIIYNYIISWKEEKELIKEFGEEYKQYKKKVPMFIPRFYRSS